MKPESDNFREGPWLLDLAIMSLLVLCASFATMAGCLKSASAVELPLEARTQNVNGYCTWCSIATLAKTHRVERLRGIAREVFTAHNGGWYPGYMGWVRSELDKRHANYLAENDGQRNFKTLEKYAATHGVVVTLSQGNDYCGNAHSVVVTSFDDERVEFWCPDRTKDKATGEPKTWKCSRAWFDRWWSGNTIVIFPDEQLATQ